MEGTPISLIMDVIVLGALGATIFYVLRLSKSLQAFKSHRQEFMKLMADLSINIEKAENAILSMKNTSKKSGETLQELIDESRLMADEMKMVNEASNNMAARLEGLAEKNSRAAQPHTFPPAKETNGRTAKNGQGFAIQDREFEEPEEENAKEDWAMDEAGVPEELQSQAERELYEALQRNRKPN